MNSNGYARIVLGVFTCLFSQSLRMQNRCWCWEVSSMNLTPQSTFKGLRPGLTSKAFYLKSRLKGTPYYRVILPIKGRPIEPLKQRARAAGFEGVWTWETDLATPKMPKTELATRAPFIEAAPQAPREASSARRSLAPVAEPSAPDRSPRAQTNISGYLKTYGVIQDSVANDFFENGLHLSGAN